MLKTLFSIIILLSPATYAAQTKTLTPVIKANGGAALGMNYMYDIQNSWTVQMMPMLSAAELSVVPETIYWTVVDLKTNVGYQDWAVISKANFSPFLNIGISRPDILRKLLPNLKSSAVVFSADKNHADFIIYLKNICDSYPNNISDATNTMNPKCVVETQQLSATDNQCTQSSALWKSRFEKGLVTCAIANAQLATLGCESLSCK